MIINIKGIYHERYEDAPFIGALICAVDCNINCTGCFNQHLKELPNIEKDSKDIINEVLSNKFNQGIILSGLEWTLQKNEMKELIYLAKQNNLKVILYTGLNEEYFKINFNDIYQIPDIYIKFGSYKENLHCNNNIQEGIKLATSNQHIYKLRCDNEKYNIESR
jgi:organic radical activating enzyme